MTEPVHVQHFAEHALNPNAHPVKEKAIIGEINLRDIPEDGHSYDDMKDLHSLTSLSQTTEMNLLFRKQYLETFSQDPIQTEELPRQVEWRDLTISRVAPENFPEKSKPGQVLRTTRSPTLSGALVKLYGKLFLSEAKDTFNITMVISPSSDAPEDL
ncbi:hypothetical protein FF38_05196 [Lucilia cuprina]|uniref:Uncharacterized protein n=1 Tax=Lucilia cuprina TaxID=7375 RepID=A0A0L0CL33_LUCCU|nr:hypothetical protein FF38_05196 [Lucilia cuprina]